MIEKQEEEILIPELTTKKKIKKEKEPEKVHPLFDNDRVRKAITNPSRIWNLDEIPETREEAWKWLQDQMLGCHKCLLSETRNHVVLPDGNLSADVMIILQNPSVNEDLTGIPLTGAMEIKSSDCGRCTKIEKCFNGRLLKDEKAFPKRPVPVVCNPDLLKNPTITRNFVLRTTGGVFDGLLLKQWEMSKPRLCWVKEYNRNCKPEDIIPEVSPWFITNTISCRPTDQEKLKDLPEATVPKTLCKPWLLLQWVILQPKVIVCLGLESLTALVPNSKDQSEIYINQIFESKYGPILFNTHPATIMRDPVKESKGMAYARLAETLKLALEYEPKEIQNGTESSTQGEASTLEASISIPSSETTLNN